MKRDDVFSLSVAKLHMGSILFSHTEDDLMVDKLWPYFDMVNRIVYNQELEDQLGFPKKIRGSQHVKLVTVFQVMIAEDLVVEITGYPDKTYQLTRLGYRIKSGEGWVAYLQEENKKQQRIDEQIESSILTNRSVTKISSKQTALLVITTIASIVSLVVTVLEYKKPDDVKVYLLTPRQVQLLTPPQDTALTVRQVYPLVKCPQGNDTDCCFLR